LWTATLRLAVQKGGFWDAVIAVMRREAVIACVFDWPLPTSCCREITGLSMGPGNAIVAEFSLSRVARGLTDRELAVEPKERVSMP